VALPAPVRSTGDVQPPSWLSSHRLTFVVIGAAGWGGAGGGRSPRWRTRFCRDYRLLITNEATITLLDGAGAVLPPFAPSCSGAGSEDTSSR